MSNTKTTWLGKLFAAIGAFFSGASAQVHDVTIIADRVANVIKSSPITSALETGIEMAIPASTGLVEAFKLELPNIVQKLNWAVAEETKTPDQMVQDAFKYLQSIKGTDDYVIQLNGFAAKVQKWLSDNQGLGLTIQQALLTPQIVHNPQLLGIANEVISNLKVVSGIVDTVVKDTASYTPPTANEIAANNIAQANGGSPVSASDNGSSNGG